MLFGRFLPMIAALAVAGSLAGKRIAPVGAGTFRTDSPTFVVLLIGVVVIVAALTFFPAFLLGPVVQGLTDQLFWMNGLRKDLTTAAIAIVFLSAAARHRLPAGDHRGRAGGVPGRLQRQQGRGRRQGRRLGADRPGLPQPCSADGKPCSTKKANRCWARPAYFQSRPSATGYSANVTYFNNLGPEQQGTVGILRRTARRLPEAASGPTTPA